jgi:hypothetical protein
VRQSFSAKSSFGIREAVEFYFGVARSKVLKKTSFAGGAFAKNVTIFYDTVTVPLQNTVGAASRFQVLSLFLAGTAIAQYKAQFSADESVPLENLR